MAVVIVNFKDRQWQGIRVIFGAAVRDTGFYTSLLKFAVYRSDENNGA
jgi:hypothetical protein